MKPDLAAAEKEFKQMIKPAVTMLVDESRKLTPIDLDAVIFEYAEVVATAMYTVHSKYFIADNQIYRMYQKVVPLLAAEAIERYETA